MRSRLSLAPMLVLLLAVGCAKAPPSLSPDASAAFQKTRVIKALDLLRDTAIAAEAQTPPLISTADTRLIVTYHQSALRIMDAAGTGWVPLVQTALEETLRSVGEPTRTKLAPYVALIRSVLTEVVQ